MAKGQSHILILEDDGSFRSMLEGVCGEFGSVSSVSTLEAALGLLSKQNFDLLLLDWHLYQSDFNSLDSILENFQPNSLRVALFTVPDLTHVISAMKSGACDIFWPAQDRTTLGEKIRELLAVTQLPAFDHAFLSRLAESMTDMAMHQKTSLFAARKEFSRTFLTQILARQKLKRVDLAHFMKVSPRTLHRHLSA